MRRNRECSRQESEIKNKAFEKYIYLEKGNGDKRTTYRGRHVGWISKRNNE